jgi:hypothetical protein
VKRSEAQSKDPYPRTKSGAFCAPLSVLCGIPQFSLRCKVFSLGRNSQIQQEVGKTFHTIQYLYSNSVTDYRKGLNPGNLGLCRYLGVG